MCRHCTRNLDTCPICRIRLPRGGIRSTIIEELIENLETVECVNDECEFKGTLDELRDHSKSCEYAEIVCPYSKCYWHGFHKNIKEHVEEAHEEEILCATDNNIILLLKNEEGRRFDAISEVFVRCPNNNIYFIVFHLIRNYESDNKISCYVQQVTKGDTSKSFVKTTAMLRRGERQICVGGTPWSIAKSTHDILSSGMNLEVGLGVALEEGTVKPQYEETDLLEMNPLPMSLSVPFLFVFGKHETLNENNLEESSIKRISFYSSE